jgi:uncharacterized protein YdcH (DUF465 family)
MLLNVCKNYPPSPIHSNQTDSAWHFPYKGELLMETNQDELKAHLMATSEEFRTLASQHCQYHKELEALEAKPHLTDEEQAEEHRLKKVKLHLKDQMNTILGRYKTQQVA